MGNDNTRFIRTVQGDIEPEKLGYCQCHEHLFIAKGISGEKVPSLIIDDFAKTSEELHMYYNMGGRAVVDAQPVGCGRMSKELLEASIQTGVHIIASTGFHKLDFYELGHFVYKLDEEQLTKLFVDELTIGMYGEGINGNQIPSTQVLARAGMLKAASDGRDIRNEEGNLSIYKKLFRAVGKAAKITGAPILTHLEMGKGADSQLDVLSSQGISPKQIIVCHLDRVLTNENLDYRMQVAQSGVYLEFDTIGRFKYHDDASEAEFITFLCEKGFEDSILIGLDTTNERMKSYGGVIGLDYILDKFRYQLQQYGIGDDLFHKFTILNPMQAICFQQDEPVKPLL